MFCFLCKCFTSYVKNLSDAIITVICTITSLTGSGLILAKYYKIEFIDNKLTWIEAVMPLAIGTGSCIIYRIVCYGLKNACCPPQNDKMIELVEKV